MNLHFSVLHLYSRMLYDQQQNHKKRKQAVKNRLISGLLQNVKIKSSPDGS